MENGENQLKTQQTHMKVTILKIRSMAKVSTLGLLETNTKESIKRMKGMDLEK